MTTSKTKNTRDKSHRFECARILIETNTGDYVTGKRLRQIDDRMDRALGESEGNSNV